MTCGDDSTLIDNPLKGLGGKKRKTEVRKVKVTCTTGWKVWLKNGRSLGRRHRCGIEAPTNTHLMIKAS